jgi:hypothetical protein
LLAQVVAHLGRGASYLLLDAVELLNRGQSLVCPSRSRVDLALGLERLVEFTPCVRPASQGFNTGCPTHRVVALIAIDLQVALIAVQQASGDVLTAGGIVLIENERMFGGTAALHPEIRGGVCASTRLVG